jgi:hypothetical protein
MDKNANTRNGQQIPRKLPENNHLGVLAVPEIA